MHLILIITVFVRYCNEIHLKIDVQILNFPNNFIERQTMLIEQFIQRNEKM